MDPKHTQRFSRLFLSSNDIFVPRSPAQHKSKISITFGASSSKRIQSMWWNFPWIWIRCAHTAQNVRVRLRNIFFCLKFQPSVHEENWIKCFLSNIAFMQSNISRTVFILRWTFRLEILMTLGSFAVLKSNLRRLLGYMFSVHCWVCVYIVHVKCFVLYGSCRLDNWYPAVRISCAADGCV